MKNTPKLIFWPTASFCQSGSHFLVNVNCNTSTFVRLLLWRCQHNSASAHIFSLKILMATWYSGFVKFNYLSTTGSTNGAGRCLLKPLPCSTPSKYHSSSLSSHCKIPRKPSYFIKWSAWNRIMFSFYIFLFNIQTDRQQNDLKHRMNGWSQVTTGVKFNCTTATQGAHHVIHLILSTLPSSGRRTGQPYRGCGIWTQFLRTACQCVARHSTDPPLFYCFVKLHLDFFTENELRIVYIVFMFKGCHYL